MAFDPAPLLQLIARAEALVARLEGVLPHPLAAPDWNASTAFRYRTRGGTAAGSSRCATSPRSGSSSLVEVEAQKERMVRNTEQFVAGKAANNVLLTGARGTGKSSLIKACLNEFAPQGLRLIEVDKSEHRSTCPTSSTSSPSAPSASSSSATT